MPHHRGHKKRKASYSSSFDPFHRFDPDGDLQLLVGDDKAVCVVDSRTLARHSLVFKSMLYGPFAEARGRNESSSTITTMGTSVTTLSDWRIPLPEDNLDGLVVIFNIIHGKFDQVPVHIELELLFSVTKMTDKYDLTEVLRPWAASWAEALVSKEEGMGTEAMLWVTWELGLEGPFGKNVKYLLENSTIPDTETGTLVFQGNVADDWEFIGSLEIIEEIRTIREATIQTVLETLRSRLNELLDNPAAKTCGCTYYSGRRCDELCPTWALGALTKAYRKAGLYPIPTVAAYSASLNDLRDAISKLRGFYRPYPECSCRKCNPAHDVARDITAIFQDMPDVLTDQHSEHLAGQREKLGL